MAATPLSARSAQLGHALQLEYLTVAWNILEGVIAIAAALASGSVALLGFGIDSFVETASGSILIWRLRAEARLRDPAHIEALDQRARRLVGASLFALAAWITFDAAQTLWTGERPEKSLVGVALTSLSVVVMLWLARAKRRAATALKSRALEMDAFQTSACFWLSLSALAGLALNGALGWWWADPAAAFVMALFIAREGREAVEGEACGCAS